MAYNPCDAFRALPGWSLEWALLPGDLLGVTCWESRSITIDIRMSELEKRSTLAHEVERVLLGRGCCESAVAEGAARKLIADEDLVGAWSPNLCMWAERLLVDVATLRTRLACLTDAERAYLGVDRALLPER